METPLIVYLASQMWLLGQILPLLIGDFIEYDDEYWLLYLQLMEIVDHLFSLKTSKYHAVYTSTLISDHHSEFCRLYSTKSVLPKMHFMVHMPRFVIK